MNYRPAVGVSEQMAFCITQAIQHSPGDTHGMNNGFGSAPGVPAQHSMRSLDDEYHFDDREVQIRMKIIYKKRLTCFEYRGSGFN